jgi:hypothetical protein
MYKKIKTKPAEMTIENYYGDYIYHCRNWNYFFVNFKKIIKVLDKYNTLDKLFDDFYTLLKRLGFKNIKYKWITTPQWNLGTYSVDGVEDAFVIYSDSYSIKIRINLIKTKTRHHYVEQDEEQKSILYFMCEKGIKERIKVLTEKQKAIDDEIKCLKHTL